MKKVSNGKISLHDSRSSNNPLVSVAVITYNQENTVRQTLDSILNQKCNFDFEIIICDDCSVDNTPDILMQFKNNFPEQIRLFINDKNIGVIKNYFKAINLCRGKYIAQCAGDDFWNRDDKLEIQVNSIQCDDNIGVVHTDADFLIEETGEIIRNRNKTKRIHIPTTDIFENLLLNNFIIAATVLFRKETFDKIYIDEYLKLNFSMEDYPLWLEISKHAKIGYIDFSTACYRVHCNSTSRSNSSIKRWELFISSFEVRNYFIKKYNPKNVIQIKIKNCKTLLSKSKGINFFLNNHKKLLFTSFIYLIIKRQISASDFKNFLLSILPIKETPRFIR